MDEKYDFEVYGEEIKTKKSFTQKLKDIWNATIFPEMIARKREEKRWKRKLKREAEIEARPEIERAFKEQYKQEVINKMKEKNKKKNKGKGFLDKLAVGFGVDPKTGKAQGGRIGSTEKINELMGLSSRNNKVNDSGSGLSNDKINDMIGLGRNNKNKNDKINEMLGLGNKTDDDDNIIIKKKRRKKKKRMKKKQQKKKVEKSLFDMRDKIDNMLK